MAKILFCSPILSIPPQGGPELHAFNTLKATLKNHRVTIASWDPKFKLTQVAKYLKLENNIDATFKIIVCKRQLITTKNKLGWALILSRAVNLLFRTVTLHSLRNNYLIAKQIRTLLETGNYDVIWFTYANISSGVISKIKINSFSVSLVSGTDSVFSQFILRSIPFKKQPYKFIAFLSGNLKKFQELSILKNSSVLTAVSEVDRDYYLDLIDNQLPVMCAYNVIDLKNYIQKSNFAKNKINPVVLLTGSFGSKYSPMDHGANWFITTVWPLVIERHKSAQLYLVGRGSEVLWRSEPNKRIKVFGQVSSIVPFMDKATVSVVPLWFESGTRFKILEAGAMNLPVVTTTLGAEGLRISDCRDVFFADDSINFARAILAILSGKFNESKNKNLQDVIINEYTVSRLISQVDAVIQRVINE
jgi:glycosyltransferase involved in cell wall biosynthesis